MRLSRSLRAVEDREHRSRRCHHQSVGPGRDHQQCYDAGRDRHRTAETHGDIRTPVKKRKTVGQGAATTIFDTISPLLGGVGGHNLKDVSDAELVTERGPLVCVAPYALDEDNADRPWDRSNELVRTGETVT
ncbi:SDR family NAD(P)-dependent oxidoreductase [Rhodococcus globerulus]|uniref:Uncharacterized protein n=1 Tax=Rhodococcus globerulus TaxID=33008 RepID=A0ABU4C4E8_RHOGO|nr:hypothetical protein [Rhodococcus globerulus]MDV6271233.1 hypothetical protein [Rhodococcus globerulus]